MSQKLQAEDDQGVNLGLESSLTLRRLLVWTYDPKIRLKTLAALVDYCQGELVIAYFLTFPFSGAFLEFSQLPGSSEFICGLVHSAKRC